MSPNNKADSRTKCFDEIYTRKDGDEIRDFLDKSNEKEIEQINKLPPLKMNWPYFACHVALHTASAYGLYLVFTATKWQTLLFVFCLDAISILGVTAGAHRLWSHRTYKAALPLRIVLAIFFTIAVQHSIVHWALDHRLHHKYSETNADPHNSKRGLFYSHIGWLLTHYTDDYEEKSATIDISDLMSDPVTKYQWKYFYLLLAIFALFLPTVIPMWFWGETLESAFFVGVTVRLLFTFHQTFLVNSAAHVWGYKPYDANISPGENPLLSLIVQGEGFHNYHHTFPWDYATSEFGSKYNFTTVFINYMAWLGLASDLKTAPKSLIESRKSRTGEGPLQQKKEVPTDSAGKLTKKD